MEKLLSLLFVVAMLGCAESDNSPVRPRDGGKDSITTTGDAPIGSDDTSVEDDTGGTCIPASAPGSICGTLPQCGCTSGQNCDVKSTDGKTECTTAGSVGINEPCTDFGQCVKGSSCIGGLCRSFCKSNSDCKSGDNCTPAQYTPSGSTTSIEVPGLDTCFTSCDPINPASDCGGQGCALLDDGTSACVAAGSATGTGACSADPNACAPGYACLSTGDCFKWCVLSSGDCSGTSGTCTGFSTPAVKDGIEYGVCAY